MGSTCDRCCTKQPEIIVQPHIQCSQSVMYNTNLQSMYQEERFYHSFNEARSFRTSGKHQRVGHLRPLLNSQNEAQTATRDFRPKSNNDREFIKQALNKLFIFNNMSENHLQTIIDQMVHYTVEADIVIIEQHSVANNFFIVISGMLEVVIDDKPQKVLKRGSSFGELALIHNTTRTATIRTLKKSKLWGVDRVTFRTAVETLNKSNYEENFNFINNVPLFENLTQEQKQCLVDALNTDKFQDRQRIVNEGDPGDLFYIVKEGQVKCSKNGEIVATLVPGNSFGEQSLLHNCPRIATITAVGEVTCLSINRMQLTKVLGDQLQQILYHNAQRMAIERIPELQQLTYEQTENLIQSMHINNYAPGQVIISAGTSKDAMIYIILKGGTIEENTGNRQGVLQVLGTDEMLGLNLGFGFYQNNIIAGEEGCDISFISRSNLELQIGCRSDMFAQTNEIIKVIKSIPLFREFTQRNLLSFITVMQTESFQKGQVIFHKDAIGDTFYILRSGEVQVMTDEGSILRTLSKNNYFGERALLLNEPRSMTIIAKTDVTCWFITKQQFLSLIDQVTKHQLLKKIELQDDKVELSELCFVKLLGKGSFGHVFLSIHTTKDRLYALKTVNRQKILNYNMFDNLKLERKILMSLDHPFIVKLVKTFKDPNRIYFLLEFVHGMELFDVIRVIGLLGENDSKFYAASLYLILEHLHESQIIYRDLKPENIMVDEDGYLRLIDFGTAKKLGKMPNERCWTALGTPNYMAPEVINGQGYSYQADYWSLGVILYEFICGGVPFGAQFDDPYQIYECILNEPLSYPNFIPKQMPARTLIDQLLNKNPSMRTEGSIKSLKNHQWFRSINWDMLLSKKLDPPYKPNIKNLQSLINRARTRAPNIEQRVRREENLDNNDDFYYGDRVTQEPEGWDSDF